MRFMAGENSVSFFTRYAAPLGKLNIHACISVEDIASLAEASKKDLQSIDGLSASSLRKIREKQPKGLRWGTHKDYMA